METQNQNRWEILLFVGKLDSRNSEACFRQALSDAEDRFGDDSAEAGLCLIELCDFLERQGKNSEAELLSRRYLSILRNYAFKLGFGRRTDGA
jgi:hypothetical protein